MKILMLGMMVLLTACGGGGGGNAPEEKEQVVEVSVQSSGMSSMWYGDSRCVDNQYIESRDCVGGRALVDMQELDLNYDRIIIHMGFNDMFKVDARVFGAHLSYLIRGAEERVWCILPTWANWNRPSEMVAAFRDEMYAACTRVVDPNIEGYQEDRIHYTDENYRQVHEVYQGIMAE